MHASLQVKAPINIMTLESCQTGLMRFASGATT